MVNRADAPQLTALAEQIAGPGTQVRDPLAFTQFIADKQDEFYRSSQYDPRPVANPSNEGGFNFAQELRDAGKWFIEPLIEVDEEDIPEGFAGTLTRAALELTSPLDLALGVVAATGVGAPAAAAVKGGLTAAKLGRVANVSGKATGALLDPVLKSGTPFTRFLAENALGYGANVGAITAGDALQDAPTTARIAGTLGAGLVGGAAGVGSFNIARGAITAPQRSSRGQLGGIGLPGGEEINPIEQAAKNNQRVRFTYTNAKGETSTREINASSFKDGKLKGQDPSTGGFRTFNEDRVEGFEVIGAASNAPVNAKANVEAEARALVDASQKELEEVPFEGTAQAISPEAKALETTLDEESASFALYGTRRIERGLTTKQIVKNYLLRMIRGVGFNTAPDDEIATPAIAEFQRIRSVAESQGAVIGSRVGNALASAFDSDKLGRIERLRGIDPTLSKGGVGPGAMLAPTIQDVAARLPRYMPYLSEPQKQALEMARKVLEPYRKVIDELGIDVSSRNDVIDGGFYLPRVVAPDGKRPVTVGRGFIGGKADWQKPEDFESQALGIERNAKYMNIQDTIRAHVESVGYKFADEHVANYFKTVTDDNGVRFAESAADRVDPGLRNEVNRLRAQLATRITTLSRRVGKFRAQTQAEKDALTVANRLAVEGGRADRLAGGTDPIAEILDSLLEDIDAMFVKSRNNTAAKEVRQDLMQLFRAYRKDVAGNNNIIRPFINTETALKRAEAETKLLEKIVKKMDKVHERAIRAEARTSSRVGRETVRGVTRSQRRTDTTRRQINETLSALDAIRAELKGVEARWKVAQEKARAIPEGASTIGLASLQGYTFPEKLASSANKVLRDLAPAGGRAQEFQGAVQVLNRMYAMVGATLDNSVLGIQGLLGLSDLLIRANPQFNRVANHVMSVNVRSWADPDVLGKYIADFDTRASAKNTLSSDRWARANLRIGGADTEFSGPGFIQRPGGSLRRKFTYPIRAATRAFGQTGDALRLEWADDLLEEQMRKTGKTATQLEAEGVTEQIAKTVNSMTGWSGNRFGGGIGDLLLFAPRFLQSRLETLGRALTPNNELENRLARRSMLKFVGGAILLTEAANRAQGHDTDYRPVVNGRPNSNFLTIRWGNRDWSLLGPWASLARTMMLVGSPITPGISAEERLGGPVQAVRQLGSGLNRFTFDFLGGEDTLGRSVRTPGERATWLANAMVPFSLQDVPETRGDIVRSFSNDEDFETKISALTAIPVELIGGKQAKLSFIDRADEISQESFQRRYNDLPDNVKRRVRQLVMLRNPELMSEIARIERIEPDDLILRGALAESNQSARLRAEILQGR